MIIALWLMGGVAGGVLFWAVQAIVGGGTIPDFMGLEIAETGGYDTRLATAIGWAVHFGVSLAYAGLFAAVALLLRPLPTAVSLAAALGAALVLGWVTTLVAPPAISVAISVLGGRGWPGELFPLNTELGLPLWNHLAFFGLNWAIQALGPRLAR